LSRGVRGRGLDFIGGCVRQADGGVRNDGAAWIRHNPQDNGRVGGLRPGWSGRYKRGEQNTCDEDSGKEFHGTSPPRNQFASRIEVPPGLGRRQSSLESHTQIGEKERRAA